MIAIWLRSDLGGYLLILAYFSEMLSWFLENFVADFWIYGIKYRDEDVVRFDGFLWFDRKSFRYDVTIKFYYVVLLSPIVQEMVFLFVKGCFAFLN